ncbi:MAG: T9SS type A sorting domain-containing protein, partial [Chitinophagaceae bacterium]|nr:T9SS type A sorting domain-containing protein [Chitinophagaceae bacterium]
NGLSYSTHVTEFTPNGATRGSGGVTTIKSFADVNACNEVGFILPLNLVSFEATKNGQQVNLQWNTDNERNMAGFEIQRSYDGVEFSSIGTQASAPNANGIGRYYFTDSKADTRSNRIYYRIKMNEQNGSAQYSPVKMVQNTTVSGMSISVYPNPVNDQISVTRPANWQQSSLQYDLFNTSGHVVKTFRRSEGGMTDQLQVGELSKGVYILRISNGTETQSQRIIKL